MKKPFESKAPRYQYFEIIIKRFWEYLKPYGFKNRKHLAFSKHVNDVIWSVGVIDITGFFHDYLQFTVEVCVYSDEMFKRIYPSRLNKEWSWLNSQIRFGLQKLGDIRCLEQEFGTSFYIYTLNQAYEFIEDALNVMKEKSMPLLQSIDSTEKIVEIYRVFDKNRWMCSVKDEWQIEWELLIWDKKIDPLKSPYASWLKINYPEVIEEREKAIEELHELYHDSKEFNVESYDNFPSKRLKKNDFDKN